jgi:peroxiredoxin
MSPAFAATALAIVLGLYVWVTVVLLRQNGRLIERVDSLEARVDGHLDAALPVFNEGDPVPSLQLPDLDGNVVDLSQPNGRKILLVFFNPDSGQCQSMVPDIKTVERVRPAGSPDLIVISRGSVETNRAYAFSSTILLDSQNASRTIFGVEQYPSAILLDGNGRIASGMATSYVGVFQLIGLVPFVPTTDETVEAMLQLATVTRDDVVYDLGCCDGRIVITAAQKYGARGVGVDINPDRLEEGRAKARQAGVEHLVRFEGANFFDANISDATVVTMYLLPIMNMRLRPKLMAELKPGTRVVSNGFDMEDWKADREIQANGDTVYLWTI